MLNFNGNLQKADTFYLSYSNRSIAYGDALYETIIVTSSKIHFLEAHYFRLMASMRMLRMKIPLYFTLEYFEEQILTTVKANILDTRVAVKLTVFRDSEGGILPVSNTIKFYITVKNSKTSLPESDFEVDLFKDFYKSQDQLSTLLTSAQPLQITASIFANENNFDSCLLLNTSKNVVEAINANFFLVNADKCIVTPPLSDGCRNGIIRKKIIEIVKKSADLKLEERSISPFEIQKAEELFLTSAIIGIQSVTKYRKKVFLKEMASHLRNQLENLI